MFPLPLPAGVCQVDKQNRAGYSPIMLTALATLKNQDDMETLLQLLRLGDVNAKASQVRAPGATNVGGAPISRSMPGESPRSTRKDTEAQRSRVISSRSD